VKILIWRKHDVCQQKKKYGAASDVATIENSEKVSILERFTNFKKLIGFLNDVAIIEV
jgi:hypothetical protein